MKRDYSAVAEQAFLDWVRSLDEVDIENLQLPGSGYGHYEPETIDLSIQPVLSAVNSYHAEVATKTTQTADATKEIFQTVREIDARYGLSLDTLKAQLDTYRSMVRALTTQMTPNNTLSSITVNTAGIALLYQKLQDNGAEYLRSLMVEDQNGRLVFNEELIYEYMLKDASELTDAEKLLLIDMIEMMQNEALLYEAIAIGGIGNLPPELIAAVSWLQTDTEYSSASAVAAEYSDGFVKLLGFIAEQDKDSASFAAYLARIGSETNYATILGVETEAKLKGILGAECSVAAYLAKYTTEYSEQYFAKLELSEEHTFGSKGEWDFDIKEKEEYEADTRYFDEDGNELENPENKPKTYERIAALLEYKETLQVSAALYKGNFELGDYGELSVTVLEAEAHAEFAAGFYVTTADGTTFFCPSVSAEVGASITALAAEYEWQALGDEMLGLNVEAGVVVGQASATASAEFNLVGENGPNIHAEASAEAIAAEAEASVGVNVLGGEVEGSVGVNVGIGAHAEIGYEDGVFSCDIGASLGVGVSVDISIDVGGMVDTVSDWVESWWPW